MPVITRRQARINARALNTALGYYIETVVGFEPDEDQLDRINTILLDNKIKKGWYWTKEWLEGGNPRIRFHELTLGRTPQSADEVYDWLAMRVEKFAILRDIRRAKQREEREPLTVGEYLRLRNEKPDYPL
jgi:hypothetical protein